MKKELTYFSKALEAIPGHFGWVSKRWLLWEKYVIFHLRSAKVKGKV